MTQLDGSTLTYSYDNLSRLVMPGQSPFDLAGNYEASTQGGPLFYNSSNQLVAFNPHADVVYAYDADGNSIHGAFTATATTIGATWSDANKLTGMSFSLAGNVTSAASCVYSADGLRRATCPSATWSAATATYFVYAGSTLIAEVNSAGTPIATYTWGASGLVSEHLGSGTSSANSLWYSYGPQGETRQLTNSSGAVADSYTYNSFGFPRSTSGTDRNPFRFGGSVGYYTDASMYGLILCGRRWYSPGYDRWLSRDPVGFEGGANLYEYCGGNPVGYLDPDGTASSRFKVGNRTFQRYGSNEHGNHVHEISERGKPRFNRDGNRVNNNDQEIPHDNNIPEKKKPDFRQKFDKACRSGAGSEAGAGEGSAGAAAGEGGAGAAAGETGAAAGEAGAAAAEGLSALDILELLGGLLIF